MNKLVSMVVSAAIAATVSTAYAGISGGGNAASVQSVKLLLVGPVESVNARAGLVTILGQKLAYSQSGKLVTGDAAAVFGYTRANGRLTATSIVDEGQYVPGASTIFLSGKVTNSDSAVGRVVVDGLAVDLTGAMSDGAVTPSVGTSIEIRGIQPAAGGLVVANGISGGGNASLGISGGGDSNLGISGGGNTSLGISGGGNKSLGISGGGTSSLGISGGGNPSLGISGGGNLGISGGGNLGISGGGSLGISGGGNLGISGGGDSSLGISGGGVSALGISGGGNS